MGQILFRDAPAVVLQGAEKGRLGFFQGYPDRSPGGGVLAGVFQKVQECLPHPFSVTADYRLAGKLQIPAREGRGEEAPLFLDQFPHVLLREREAIAIGAEPLQAQKPLNQVLHPGNLGQAGLHVRGGVQLGIDPEGGQGRFQLVGNVRGQTACPAALLLLQLSRPNQPVLQLAQRVLEHGEIVLPQGHIHGLSRMVQEILRLPGQLPDAPVLPPAEKHQRQAGRPQGRCQENQSTH